MTIDFLENLFKEAYGDYVRGDFLAAIEKYKKILAHYPMHPEIIYRIGISYLRLGQIDQATEWIEKSVLIDRGEPTSLSNLGYCLNLMGRYQEAIQVCGNAVNLNPENAGAWTNLGNAQKGAGLTGKARESYRKALEIEPNNPLYIFNFANVLYDEGEYAAAAEQYFKCLETDNSIPEAHNNLAACLLGLRKPDSALDRIDLAIELKSDYAEAWNNRGNALRALKRHEEALAAYERSAELKPDYAEAWNNQGITLTDLGRHLEALHCLQQLIQLRPHSAEAWSYHGVTLNELKRHEEALASHNRAIELAPKYMEAWNNRGIALNDLKRFTEALASYDHAITIAPDNAEVWTNRGVTLGNAKRNDEALTCHEQSIALQPGHARAWFNRGNTLNDLRRYEEALTSFDRSIELKPDYADAWNNRGNALRDVGRYDEALASYERAITADKEYADAHYNKGLLELQKKDFKTGFENYLFRWKTPLFSDYLMQTGIPSCESAELNGDILLWAEQGIGDEIFYAGMLTASLSTRARVTLSADQRLHPIFKRSFPNIHLIDRRKTDSEIFHSGFDYQAPIGDLGHLLKLDLKSIEGSRQSFLLPNPEKSSQFKSSKLFRNGRIVCGISWRSANKVFGEAKSLRLSDLAPLLANKNTSLVSLQYGDVDLEIDKFRVEFGIDIHQFKGLDIYQDVDDLLGLIDACDFVITTSNVTAHLAGAIGKKGCVIIPFSKGRLWYWHFDDFFSTWYPSLRVFYQDDPDSWSSTIEQVANWVKELC